ncbi:MAG: glycosyltransferase, partial [Phormidesmis sp.]
MTSTSPLQDCRVCVIVPVRNEAGHLPAMIEAIAHQVNEQGQPINPNSYELLVLANNCSDDSAAIARSLSKTYPALQLHVLEVNLPPAQAHVGKARQMVMNEAYRRLSTIGLDRRIIASTDGDTEVSPTWISTLLKEFDKGVDAVGGRILTQRAAAVEINQDISLHYLRRLA